MLRRCKGNVLLTGSAGCGKTAIAEGLAGVIATNRTEWLRSVALTIKHCEKDNNGNTIDFEEPAKPLFCDYIIYDLSMNSLVSGSKYRGEFEKRLDAIIKICREHPEVILFIDEIHQMCAIGDSEGSSNMGQILKPALARGDIHVIGATTTEESQILKKDKALARRFSEVTVPQLVGDSAISCTENVLNDYSKFHGVKCRDINAKELVEKVSYFLTGSVFPNNVIDVVDETLASARFANQSEITMKDINKTLSRMTGSIILQEVGVDYSTPILPR